MPHIFPEKAFLVGEVVDPDDITLPFQEIAGKLGGRLNEHDISTDLKTKVPVEDEAYYDARQIVRASDPNFTRGGSFWAQFDSVAGDAVANVQDTEGWQTLTDLAGTQDMSRSLTCGDDTLVIFALAQHFGWFGTGSSDNPAPLGTPLRLQYALRVDGAVLDDTITGAAVYPDPPPQQWYRATTAAATDFDYRHIQYLQGTGGISCSASATRLVRSLPVAPGVHTVELVARRLPPADYTLDVNGSPSVQVLNRRLFVLRIKGMPAHTGEAPDVTIPAFRDGDVVDASDITTNGFTRLATAINALGNANLERGALRNEHLPSRVYGAKVTAITPASPTTIFNGVYPGYGTDDPAWTTINDGVGNDLIINGPTAGEWRLDTFPGLFVVIANVELSSIAWNPAASVDISALCILALRITNSAGTVTVIGSTEVAVNGHNPDPEVALTMRPVCIDVPLMWVVDSTQLSDPDKRIVSVEVVGSTWDGDTGAVQVDARTQRGILYAFALQGVYL